jgi:hypothetical protein
MKALMSKLKEQTEVSAAVVAEPTPQENLWRQCRKMEMLACV